LIAILFVVAGVWKITDPFAAAARLAQAQVPGSLSLPAAVLLGISEMFAGVLIAVPRFRRWGAWLTAAMLVVFMIYIAAFYNVLRGEECNCFPWVKRAVGPGFFIADGVMLLLAVVAGWWARRSTSLRSAALVLLAVAVFAGVSFGLNATRRASIQAPPSINVDGKTFQLDRGRVFLFFFNPECTHCDQVARQMAGWSWKDVRLVGVVTELPQFAEEFMQDTGLRAPVSFDIDRLRRTFAFTSTPYGVALDDGRQLAAFVYFDEQEPRRTLERLGYIH
jgi:uncharacterized membrane protein YphA (DoxX/SURF4 family)